MRRASKSVALAASIALAACGSSGPTKPVRQEPGATGVDQPPPAPAPEPARCAVSHDPPVGGFGDAVLHVESEDPDARLVVTLDGKPDPAPEPGPRVQLRAAGGTYTLEVQDRGDTVRCEHVELVIGGVTTVRVRFPR